MNPALLQEIAALPWATILNILALIGHAFAAKTVVYHAADVAARVAQALPQNAQQAPSND